MRCATVSILPVIVLGVVACREDSVPPSPLGNLTPERLAMWVTECPTQLVVEDVCGRVSPQPDCNSRHYTLQGHKRITEHASATRRFHCRAPQGWSIWVDARDRVHGICVDPGPDERWGEVRRAYPLLARDLGTETANLFRTHIEHPERMLPLNWTFWAERPGRGFRLRDDIEDQSKYLGYLQHDSSKVVRSRWLMSATCVSVDLGKWAGYPH